MPFGMFMIYCLSLFHEGRGECLFCLLKYPKIIKDNACHKVGIYKTFKLGK